MRDCAAQEADRCHGFLVLEHLDVRQPGRVVDRDMDVLPTDPATASAPVAVDAVARPSDPAELLDVDVDELARTLPLVAVGRVPWVVLRRLTTQAQRLRPRDAAIATATARRRSLQRMVRPLS